MGNDEHGPAYPEPPRYRCPVCGINDCDAYLRCYDGGCPDGRDQSRLRPAHWDDPAWTRKQRPSTNTVRSLVGWATFFALALWLMWPH